MQNQISEGGQMFYFEAWVSVFEASCPALTGRAWIENC